jgi:hypothetical protein
VYAHDRVRTGIVPTSELPGEIEVRPRRTCERDRGQVRGRAVAE